MRINNPEISIIIPVFNAEKYIVQCLESIKKQTFTAYEVILVNDGSTDRSGSICDKYAEDDKRIIVCHQKNGGVSKARQTGITAASGRYSIHVDVDDWVEPDMLADMYQLAISSGSDMVIADFYRDRVGKISLSKEKPTGLSSFAVLEDMLKGKLMGSTCNKMVRHSLYKKYDIKFPENINYCEDFVVISFLLLTQLKVSYLPKAYYHYVQNSSSITHTVTKTTFENRFRFIEIMSELVKDHPSLISALSYTKLDVQFSMIQSGLYSLEECRGVYAETDKVVFTSRYSLNLKVLLFLFFKRRDLLFSFLYFLRKKLLTIK